MAQNFFSQNVNRLKTSKKNLKTKLKESKNNQERINE